MSVVGFYTGEKGRRRPITARQVKEYASRLKWMSTAERNRLTEIVLGEEFPNVFVKEFPVEWTRITITEEMPHPGECEPGCVGCKLRRLAIKERVWQLLREHGLEGHFPVRYDDAGVAERATIIVNFVPRGGKRWT